LRISVRETKERKNMQGGGQRESEFERNKNHDHDILLKATA